ncbi:MAG: cytochrome c oxidase subunit I [Candidatus Hodarchaeales archaeon]|jgi:cytochrome c oxidase subunit 1
MAEQTQKSFFTNLKTLFGTTNHADIGKLYIAFSLINFVISGLLALIIRIELAFPGPTIIDEELYSIVFTAHGTTMIFLVVFPLGVGFGNYLVPTFIGAIDMYWPRWNNAAFWMLLPASFLLYLGETSVGWTLYTPLSLGDFGIGVNTWILGVLIAGVSSLVSSINFILTIATMRRDGLKWLELDLFSWSILLAAIMQFLAIPIITTGLVFLLSDRILGTTFFSALDLGAGAFLWQHVFWSYSHPAVYIMILPAFGLMSLLVSKFSRNEIFGYKSMVGSMMMITILGFFVWGHHQYTIYGASADAVTTAFFNFLTFIIAVPSGIKTFNWLLTMWGGRIKFEVPLVLPLGFIIGFVIGGITGVWLNIIPIDIVVHDTYFVVGHFHLIIIGGAVTAILGGFHNFFPEMTGKMYNRKLAWIHCLSWIVGVIITFFAMMIVGILGMPRRYFDYSNFSNVELYAFWHMMATFGALLMAFSVAVLLLNIVFSLFVQKEPAGDDPFRLKDFEKDSNTTVVES